ncbi:rubredoxin [Gloeobacter kilaueensis]|uniref:Rubredoxin n=1 Tax=Gloeobacter kilaueensis (strain ATCC BAA-2537 / CCAP 1431/1 / ULC 316 / JS1) TaxID=1183438 RepID=U5QKD6_GLOK1|nr:rubredoxin [Gloeobacter kilaueensis]AGY59437.1 rubredoxin [Gloeobacter kilaueensis JS1]
MTTQITDPTQLDRYECRTCGYIYEPTRGEAVVAAGTAFEDLPAAWKCPVCSSPSSRFKSIGPKVGTVAGFEENAGYGWGVNLLNPQAKNLLIFGALFLGFAFFMSIYFLSS